MGASGNPAKKAAAKKVSSAAQFKQRKQGNVLELPSGIVVRAKRVELQTMIMQGAVPNPLMEVVNEALEKGKKADVAKLVGVDEGKVDLEMVRDMYEMVNAVVVECVLEPKIHELPEDEDERDDELVYIDEVDDTDKMFLFQWASGGTSDLEQFRREADADMAALAESQGSSATA